MEYKIIKQVKDHDLWRSSFIKLAVKTFDLSFQEWYNNGFWTDQYMPYALVIGDTVIANASVNQIDTVWKGQVKHYIQIGTVMTDGNYQNKGYSRKLLEEILRDWTDKCDAVYLYANHTVLDFYPKFGFKKGMEYQYSMPVLPNAGDFRKLNMDHADSQALLMACYKKSNPYSQLTMENNVGLLMFYCTASRKDCVYYSKEYDAAAIAMQSGENLFCFDLFCDAKTSLSYLLSKLAAPETKNIILGFTPKSTKNLKCAPIRGEDTLFVLSSKENLFADYKVMFPTLSHA